MIKSFVYTAKSKLESDRTGFFYADQAIFSDGDHGDNKQASPPAFHTTVTGK